MRQADEADEWAGRQAGWQAGRRTKTLIIITRAITPHALFTSSRLSHPLCWQGAPPPLQDTPLRALELCRYVLSRLLGMRDEGLGSGGQEAGERRDAGGPIVSTSFSTSPFLLTQNASRSSSHSLHRSPFLLCSCQGGGLF